MARPKEFDQEKALRKAIGLFSKQGFAATSTDDLMRVMDVGRQSMYDTFGDKRALFLKALKMYVAESVHSINVELERPGSALFAVQKALVTFAERKDLCSAEGCMGLNAIGEFGQRDEDVSRITRKAARLLRQTLIRVLTTAKKQKELRSDADLDSMADFFEGTLAGIRMAAKAGKSRRALRNIAAFAGRAYMGLDCARGTAARLRSNENTETVRDKARILGRGNGKKKLLGVLLPGGTRNEADTSATGDVQ